MYLKYTSICTEIYYINLNYLLNVVIHWLADMVSLVSLMRFFRCYEKYEFSKHHKVIKVRLMSVSIILTHNLTQGSKKDS